MKVAFKLFQIAVCGMLILQLFLMVDKVPYWSVPIVLILVFNFCTTLAGTIVVMKLDFED